MSQFVYRFTKGKRINAKTVQRHTVTVYTLKGKEIGSHSFSYLTKDSEKQIQEYVSMLIREYQLKQVFSKMSQPTA